MKRRLHPRNLHEIDTHPAVRCFEPAVVVHSVAFVSPGLEGDVPSLPKTRRPLLALLVVLGVLISLPMLFAGTSPWVTTDAKPGDFPLVQAGVAAPIRYSTEDYKVVSIAAGDFAADVERVTGIKPVVIAAPAEVAPRGKVAPQAVWVGTLGHSPLIDRLVADGKLDVAELRGKWESFLIATVENPQPGVAQVLVVAGSDRRGTAFGVYELSQAIGVSPWYWWADVVPQKQSALHVAAGTREYGPPSVQYRGIFINDEDWGLQPWAAKTFAPEEGGIGPKVYRRVFELLLRLKANTLWPAMHACSKPFNSFPENAKLADDYAIVMGSSHAEPMLRNNVREWTAPKDSYNYLTNRDGVLKYWEERVQANGKFENFYTLGMRGIHDSAMVGPKTDAERIATLEKIFADQRALIAKYVRPEVEQVPQLFCAYKEVLDLYRKGLKVPDDVTIMWPDDNFGYIRNFATAEEQRRAGGFGVYYHVSYLGKPLSYLWLCTTPPALIWEEMNKAYEYGARKIWILNVGDIKPAEIDIEFFLQMAWDVERWNRETLPDFLPEWALREFGAKNAKDIAEVMSTFYRLNYERKPEHLQWWLPGQPKRPSSFSPAERETRIRQFDALQAKIMNLKEQVSTEQADAFNELVGYPVSGSVLANRRYFCDEMGQAAAADEANRELSVLCTHFNEYVAAGKWRGINQLEPADSDWKSMRIARWEPRGVPDEPPENRGRKIGSVYVDSDQIPPPAVIEAEQFAANMPASSGAAWASIPGLGTTGSGSVSVFPVTARPVSLEKAKADAPRLDYRVQVGSAGNYTLIVYLVPAHPIFGDKIRFALALDEGEPQLAELAFKDGSADWAQGVLDNTRTVNLTVKIPSPGEHTLRIYGLEPGVVMDKFALVFGEPRKSYGGPEKMRVSGSKPVTNRQGSGQGQE